MKTPKRRLTYIEIVHRRNQDDDEVELRMLAKGMKPCIDWLDLFLVQGEVKVVTRGKIPVESSGIRRVVNILNVHTSVGCIQLRYDSEAE